MYAAESKMIMQYRLPVLGLWKILNLLYLNISQ